jgi:adenylosuccinate lyase
MLRVPMSRMDILSDEELKEQIASSDIAKKYNKEIDRESAYELLEGKIKRINDREKKDDVEKAKTKKTITRKSTRMNPILKVVTSATFIRGVLGILKRVMK